MWLNYFLKHPAIGNVAADDASAAFLFGQHTEDPALVRPVCSLLDEPADGGREATRTTGAGANVTQL